jgi:hypothetical protein
MVLLCSISAVNFRFGCTVLKSASMDGKSVLLESNIKRMSSTNRR